MLINLKREVQEQKDIVFQRDDEILCMKMSMKLTKIQEIECELRVYVTECLRLRKVTEDAIKISGEFDFRKLQD